MRSGATGLMVLAAAASMTLAADGASQGAKSPDACFSAANFRAWKAADGSTIFVRASRRRYYRLDLMGICPQLTMPGARLITTFTGSRRVCSALDWNLRVAGPATPATVCRVRSMTPLSPAQVAAIPADDRP
jgi:hypothetical protein